MEIFLELNYYYNKYPHISLVKNKMEIVKKFKSLENSLLLSKNILNLDEIIFKQLNFTVSFSNYRYIYLLSQINSIKNIQENILQFIFKFFDNFIYSSTYYPHIHYLIKILAKFFTNKIEEKILTFKNKPIFDTYLKEFIILMGNIGGKSSLSILFSIIKKDFTQREYCFLSSGKITSYQRYPVIKRTFLKDYINFICKILHRDISINQSSYLYYSLIEIFLLPNGIDGKLQNKLSEVLYLHKDKNLYKNIALKVINNSLLDENEKNLIKSLYLIIPL